MGTRLQAERISIECGPEMGLTNIEEGAVRVSVHVNYEVDGFDVALDAREDILGGMENALVRAVNLCEQLRKKAWGTKRQG